MTKYVKLDDHNWITQDFTDDNTLALTGTIYSDKALQTPFDITGYTLTFRFIDMNGFLVMDNLDDISAISPTDGTWRLKPQSGRSGLNALGNVSIRMEKSGSRVTAVGVNGSSKLHMEWA